jgi:hypothetical protein
MTIGIQNSLDATSSVATTGAAGPVESTPATTKTSATELAKTRVTPIAIFPKSGEVKVGVLAPHGEDPFGGVAQAVLADAGVGLGIGVSVGACVPVEGGAGVDVTEGVNTDSNVEVDVDVEAEPELAELVVVLLEAGSVGQVLECDCPRSSPGSKQ